jgi:hypothetical protein
MASPLHQQIPEPRGELPVLGRRRAPLGISLTLWTLLGLSLLFLLAVRVYVSRIEPAASPTPEQVAEVPILATQPMAQVADGRSLRLDWDPVAGATTYRIWLHTIDGNPVVAPASVWGTEWRAPAAARPPREAGRYVWTVEALDSSGKILARSRPAEVTIGF